MSPTDPDIRRRAPRDGPAPGARPRDHAMFNDPTIGEPPLRELIGAAIDGAKDLARAEVRLARAELVRGAAASARALGMLAGALALALGGTILLLIAIMAALVALGLPAWLAALLMAVLAFAGAAVLARAARGAGTGLLPRTRAQLDADRRTLAAALGGEPTAPTHGSTREAVRRAPDDAGPGRPSPNPHPQRDRATVRKA